ncbi:MAG: hypothetical protein WKF30_03865 [Pyrinomonadaceae bacterium]
MSNTVNKVFCQNCRAANSIARELCVQCGTRLMLVATSTIARHEDNTARYIHEEHLLERISVLENHLSQLGDKVGETLDLLLRQAKTAHLDQTLLESLIDVLGQAKLIDGRKLRATWHERSGDKSFAEPLEKVWQTTRANMLAEFRGPLQEEFARQLDQAIGLIARGEVHDAALAFNTAALFDAQNPQLNLTIGGCFSPPDNSRAPANVSREHSVRPENSRIVLLLGLIAAEQGELDKADQLLVKDLKRERGLFALECARGLLRGLQGQWSQAIKDFRRAHAVKPGAASFFLLGFSYYDGGHYGAALKAFERAGELAADQGVIAYLRGIVLLKLREPRRAKEWLNLAFVLDARCPLYRAAARRPSLKTASLPELFVGTGTKPRLKLSQRAKFISDAIYEDAISLDGDS